MKHLLLAGVLLTVGAAPAYATLQIAFSNSGGGTFFCADQTACDLDGAAKNLLLLNTFVGNIKIEGTFAASMTHPDSLSVSNLTITNLGTTTETLDMAVGDTGFAGPITFLRTSASATFNVDNAEPFTLSFWGDHADTQPAATALDLPGLNLFNVSGTVDGNPGSAAGTRNDPFVQGSGVFSLAEGAALTLSPGASITGFNQSMAGGVPETKTWVMMLAGFGLMAFFGFKRRRSNMFAF